MPITIAVLGGFVVDFATVTSRLPDQGETIVAQSFSTHLGGKGYNSAVAAYRASRRKPAEGMRSDSYDGDEVTVRMIGAIGDDEWGPKFQEDMLKKGLDTKGVRVLPERQCGYGVVIIESDEGENRIMLVPGANYALEPDHFSSLHSLQLGGPKPDLLIAQLEIKRETIEHVLDLTKANDIEVLLNPAPANFLLRRLYSAITHLVINETEAEILAGETVDFQNLDTLSKVTDVFIDGGVKNVVITLGSRGAFFSNTRGYGELVDAEQNIDVVDTTGAGDTFVGTYAVEYAKQKRKGQWDIKKAVERACKASARTIGALGAQEAIPWSDEIGGFEAHI